MKLLVEDRGSTLREIHFEVIGEGDPLVMLHGFTGSIASWRRTGYIKPLSQGFQLILIDQIGHGKSSKHHQVVDYDLKLRARDVIMVLNHLKIEKANIWGYSMGGRIAFTLGRYHPHRCIKLVMGAIHADKRPYEKLNLRIETFKKGLESYADEIEERYQIKLTDKQREGILGLNLVSMIANLSYTRDWVGMMDQLPKITSPSLVYVGTEDEFFSGAKKCAELMPDSKFISYPNLSHSDTLKESEIIIPDVIDFLNPV